MKHITTKTSILSKVALITIISFTGSYTYANHCEHHEVQAESIDKLGGIFMSVERLLADFVNSSNKTPFNTFVTKLGTKLQELQRRIETLTRSNNDIVSAEVDKLMDYALQQFNILYSVFKKYNGKPAAHAKAFGDEIKKEFNTEKIFSEMVVKLETIKTKASHENNKHLLEKIDKLITLIKQKKNEWKQKADLVLWAGLTARMGCN